MLNWRLLKAPPNYVAIPVIVAFWIAIAVLGMELLGAKPFMAEKG